MGKSFKASSIFRRLNLKQTHRKSFRSGLKSLINENLIIKEGKHYKAGRTGSSVQRGGRFHVGTIDYGKDGRKIVRIGKGEKPEDLLKINNEKSYRLKIGDKVEFKIMMNESSESSAKISAVLETSEVTFTGRYERNGRHGLVIPDSRDIKKDVIIHTTNSNKAKHGDKVFVKLENPAEISDQYSELTGIILEVIGKPGEKQAEERSIMLQFGLVKEFPKKVNSETRKIDESISLEGRLDLRDKDIFTIDPLDAKDFDDAVSIEKLKDGTFLLGVHIADVSHYVKEGTAIDAEAMKRATSAYLVRNVIPMLPEKLSNGLCSLKPNEDRHAFSILINLSKRFTVKDFKITESVINSKRRFTYEEAQKIIDSGEGDFADKLKLMHKISKSMTLKRLASESLDFDSNEVKFTFDKKGNVKDIVVKHRLDSMRLIEEFMLLANKCATQYVNNLSRKLKTELPFIYRVHDVPNHEKIEELAEFVKQFGYTIDPDNKDSLRKLLEDVTNKPEEFIINDLLIRSMSKAIYSPKNIGHYGLGFKDYTHFTSPIRRYPDLIVHRLLKIYLNPDKINNAKAAQFRIELPDICRHCSLKEQNAEIAERESIKLMQAQFISRHVGDEFEGIISSVVHFGMFVEIMDILVEGMVRYKDMDDDYYDFDERKKTVKGRRKGKTYRAGQTVTVKVIRVNLESRRIDFALVT